MAKKRNKPQINVQNFIKNKINHSLNGEFVFLASGIHPLDSKSIIEEPESWLEYESIANQPECVAIGPCGLDYQRDFSEPDVQKEIFEKQLELAIKLNKPVMIHERSAQTDVLNILSKYYFMMFNYLPIFFRNNFFFRLIL